MPLRDAAILAFCLTTAAHAQSTAFTYQGQLMDAGQPAAGLHDFRFTLFDAPSGGAQVGTSQCADNIVVSDGLFAAAIDFGEQFATTSSRFLQVEVRADTGLSCANPAGFVTLADRQTITATPIAAHAKSAATAFSLNAPGAPLANAVSVDNAGKLGIGTAAPTHPLHIANVGPTIALQDTDSTTQQVGYISYRDSANAERAWVGYGSPGSPDFSVINARPSGSIYLTPFFGNVVLAGNGGNVGVGTSTPSSRLDVRGSIRFGNSGQFHATAALSPVRIVCAAINSTGSEASSNGYIVSRLTTGNYTVAFTTAFTAEPAVTATPVDLGDGPVIAMVANVTSTGCTIRIMRLDGTLINRGFHFIAAGPM